LSDFSAIVVLHQVGRLVAAVIWRGKAVVMAGLVPAIHVLFAAHP
jgi:hypothetical protein